MIPLLVSLRCLHNSYSKFWIFITRICSLRDSKAPSKAPSDAGFIVVSMDTHVPLPSGITSRNESMELESVASFVDHVNKTVGKHFRCCICFR